MTAIFSRIEVPETPNRADREVILQGLVVFEEAVAGPLHIKPLAILIKDDAGKTIGGLWGTSMFRWLVIELLFVPEQCRGEGLGTTIMAEAERIARERGCIGIWLDTYSFQAPHFYERLGFQTFGTLEGQPPGERRLFMQKALPG